MTSNRHTPANKRGAETDLQQVLQQGNLLLQKKNYRQALEICHRYLETAPNSTDILNLAGIISDHNNQRLEAADYFRRAIKIEPDNALLHCNLANTLKKSGHIQEAITAYQTALRYAPGHQTILLDLGNLYMYSGNHTAAVQIFQQLLNINPGHGTAFHQLEQYYKTILGNNPDDIGALCNLGVALKLVGRFEEALQCFINANNIAPDDSNALRLLGDIYYLLDRPAEAEPVYRQATELRPDDAALHSNLGIVLDNQGKSTEAIEQYRKAIAIDPAFAQAHKLLAYANKHDEYDQDIKAMENLLASASLTNMQKAALNLGLGKAYEDLRDYDNSFTYYADANTLERISKHYDTATDERLFDNIIQTFNRALFERLKGCGHEDSRPVFIVGMPRSGTTLLEQILASHPDVNGAGELHHLGNIIRGYFNTELHSHFPENMERVTCHVLSELGRQYSTKTIQLTDNARYFTDKMPHNFLYIGMIKLMLPAARIIHCTRNPLDTCLSCYTNSFRGTHLYSHKLDELGRYYSLYHRLMRHWHQIADLDIVDVSYETLINDQESETRRLLDACGLPWNDSCLSFHKNERTIMTTSVRQVRHGLYNRSVRRWKHFEPRLTPLIDALRSGGVDEASWL